MATQLQIETFTAALEKARKKLAAAVALHTEANEFAAAMSPALRITMRNGIERVIELRMAEVARCADRLASAQPAPGSVTL
jgi:hypothetical protein